MLYTSFQNLAAFSRKALSQELCYNVAMKKLLLLLTLALLAGCINPNMEDQGQACPLIVKLDQMRIKLLLNQVPDNFGLRLNGEDAESRCPNGWDCVAIIRPDAKTVVYHIGSVNELPESIDVTFYDVNGGNLIHELAVPVNWRKEPYYCSFSHEADIELEQSL
jgi:hypothetical protein